MWAVVGVTVLLATATLDLQIAVSLLTRGFEYLPQLMIGAAILAAGGLVSLGVGRQILVASFTILFGGLVFALSLAFGLAGRDMARELLERLRRRPERAPEDSLRQHL
jgi:hypothetical protein